MFKINMNLEMEGGTEQLAAPVEAVEPLPARAGALRRLRRGGDPRAAGPDGRALGRLCAGRGRARRPGRADARRTSRAWSSASCCAAWRRSCSIAAPGSPRTAWAYGRCPRTGSRRSGRGWPPCAACRTATAARRIPTGPTACSRWRTAVRRRSATRCSTASRECAGSSGDDRATLYSSTEYKKVRLHYFTPDYADVGGRE